MNRHLQQPCVFLSHVGEFALILSSVLYASKFKNKPTSLQRPVQTSKFPLIQILFSQIRVGKVCLHSCSDFLPGDIILWGKLWFSTWNEERKIGYNNQNKTKIDNSEYVHLFVNLAKHTEDLQGKTYCMAGKIILDPDASMHSISAHGRHHLLIMALIPVEPRYVLVSGSLSSPKKLPSNQSASLWRKTQFPIPLDGETKANQPLRN